MGPRICFHPILLVAIGALTLESLPAQTAGTSSTKSPVAYVYVTRPTHLDGFAASASGRLTPVPGSPFSNIALSHLSVTDKFLFGAGDDNQSLFSFAIVPDGSIRQVGQINAHDYPPDGNDCYSVGPTQVDFARKTVYNDNWNCDQDSQYIQSYKIEPSGQLTFLKNTGTESNQYAMTHPVVLGTDQYIYVAGAYTPVGDAGGQLEALKRESDGTLDMALPSIPLPKPANPDDLFTPDLMAIDPYNHVAVEMSPENMNTGYGDGPAVLASFIAQPDGNLTTTNSPDQMIAPSVVGGAMSISPTGKLLAIGGGWPDKPTTYAIKGFQILHFSGGNPITKYSSVLQNKYVFTQFAWDKHNHLYALSSNYLFVYTVTPTSIKQAPGSPYLIPKESSLIVLSLP